MAVQKMFRKKYKKYMLSARMAGVFLLPALLGACALPIPLQVTGWALDGISYLTTSKSISDHGLSALAGKDCAVHRILSEGDICRTTPDDVLMATAPDATPRTDADRSASVAFVNDWEAPAIDEDTPLSRDRSHQAYVLGNFSDPANADMLKRLAADLNPTIMPVTIGGRAFYRVIVGPVKTEERDTTRTAIELAGFYDVQTLDYGPIETAEIRTDDRG